MNCPSSPGSLADASFAAIVTTAVSSSLIVTVAVSAAPIEMSASPDVIEASVSVTDSLSSRIVSSITARSISAELLPAKIVTEPLKVVKSSPAVASPLTPYATTVSTSAIELSVTVN